MGILALTILVGMTFGVVAIAGAVQDSSARAATADGAAAAATPTPTSTPTASSGYVPVACARDALSVTESTARESYAAGSTVAFSLTVVNDGLVPCLIDGGSASLGVVITSGTDRVWSSVHCPQGTTERPLLLDVGASHQATVSWSQERSATGCPAGLGSVEPGTYRAVVTATGGMSTVPSWEWLFAIR